MALVIDLPHSHYRPVPRPYTLERPPLTWLALALALALVGLLLASLVTTLGLAGAVNPYSLALFPTCGGLAIALAMFYLEVTWNSVSSAYAPAGTFSAC